MSGKMSKTARQATRAGRGVQTHDGAAPKLAGITVLGGIVHRFVFDGQGRTACGQRATLGWHYGSPDDIECEACRGDA